MYQISELAESVGLSRATLLYYEKLGLLKARRQANGYRVYTDADRQRLRLMQQLQAGGLSLQESKARLGGKLDRDMLGLRLNLDNARRWHTVRAIASRRLQAWMADDWARREGTSEYFDQIVNVALVLPKSGDWMNEEEFLSLGPRL